MKIDRLNYEIWLIDLLEGNLSEIQAERVNNFLERNPDIREEFNDLKLLVPEPGKVVFKNKDLIRKTPAEISDSQFELLCSAFHEGDLRTESVAELMEITDSDNDRKRTFDLIGKVKLVPPSDVYKNKHRLFRRTPLQKIIRLSYIGLSSAAAIALFITLSLLTFRYLHDKPGNSARNTSAYPDTKEILFEIPAGNVIRAFMAVTVKEENRTIPVHIYTAELIESDSLNTVEREPSLQDLKLAQLAGKTITLTSDPDLLKSTASFLIPSKTTAIIPSEEIYMSNVERFITKIFREKVLREKVTKDTPLKGYELAAAGVDGLNKLLGWEMALNEKNNENGELESLYFSSKILKFNAPVKKTSEEQ